MWGEECGRSLTTSIKEKAEESGLYTCSFVDKPECFLESFQDEDDKT